MVKNETGTTKMKNKQSTAVFRTILALGFVGCLLMGFVVSSSISNSDENELGSQTAVQDQDLKVSPDSPREASIVSAAIERAPADQLWALADRYVTPEEYLEATNQVIGCVRAEVPEVVVTEPFETATRGLYDYNIRVVVRDVEGESSAGPSSDSVALASRRCEERLSGQIDNVYAAQLHEDPLRRSAQTELLQGCLASAGVNVGEEADPHKLAEIAIKGNPDCLAPVQDLLFAADASVGD